MRLIESKTLLSSIVLSSVFAGIAIVASACNDDDNDSPAAPNLGSITVTSRQDAEGQFAYTVNASFSDTYDATVAGCTTRAVGECSISKCPAATADAGPFKYSPAGTLTVSGGLLQAPGVTIPSDADNFYYATAKTKAWEPGQQITAKSTGAQIPAFELSVSTPPALTLEAPATPIEQALVIPRSAPLELRWSAVQAKKYVALYPTDANGDFNTAVTVSCTFASDAATATIPASVLGELPKGDAFLRIATRNDATTLIGGKTVALYARTIARTASGALVQRGVTLE